MAKLHSSSFLLFQLIAHEGAQFSPACLQLAVYSLALPGNCRGGTAANNTTPSPSADSIHAILVYPRFSISVVYALAGKVGCIRGAASIASRPLLIAISEAAVQLDQPKQPRTATAGVFSDGRPDTRPADQARTARVPKCRASTACLLTTGMGPLDDGLAQPGSLGTLGTDDGCGRRPGQWWRSTFLQLLPMSPTRPIAVRTRLEDD